MRHTRVFWCGDPKVCLQSSLKILDLALPQIFTRIFHLWKSAALDNAWDGDSRPFIFFLSRVFARLEMRRTRNFGIVILNYAYCTF